MRGKYETNTLSLVLPLLFFAAKYPCLQLRDPGTKDEREQHGPALHFGSVAVGQSLQKHFDIFNPSPVSSAQRYTNVHSQWPSLSSLFFPLSSR